MYYFIPGDYGSSFQFIRQLVYVGFGAGEFYEIDKASQLVDPKNPGTWYEAWKAVGDHARAEAQKAEEQGHLITAAHRYRCAAGYYRAGEFYLKPHDERKIPLYDILVDSFKKGVTLEGDGPEFVEIPYENSFMYGIFKATKKLKNGKAPCVVMFGGLDSIKEELYFQIAEAWNNRGLSVLIVDGPGQGGTLRYNHIGSRYDYEAGGSAAFDYLEKRNDVELDKVAVCALSMGGYYAPRIAAFEPRYAAVVAWGAQYDYGAIWQTRPETHDLAMHFQWIMGADNMQDARDTAKAFTLSPEILARIKCPALILHGCKDKQIPLKDAQRLHDDMINSPKKELRVFTEDEGGVEHCQGDFGYLAVSYIGDWLSDLFVAK